MITSETKVAVRYAETDMMGIVYHANYLPWLEIGRTELLRENGLPYKMLEQMGYFLPVLDVSIRYHRPARYDDCVTIRTELREKPGLRIRLDYELTVDDALVARAQTQHAFINREGQPVRPPAVFVETMTRLFG